MNVCFTNVKNMKIDYQARASATHISAPSKFPVRRCISAVISQILIREYIGSVLLTRSSCEDMEEAISDKVFST